MIDYNLAASFVLALTGNAEAVITWRVIHDKDKGALGKNITGTLPQCWQTLADYNAAGWGVFCNINEMDGNGSELANVRGCRVHVIDLDKPESAVQSYQQAVDSLMPPQFAVNSSPGKYHVYWRVHPYVGNEFYTLQQRKLIQIYNSDKSIIDATRVMRVPGFLHQKNEPFLVNFTTLAAYQYTYTADDIAAGLSHINIIEHVSLRAPLGTPEMAAPDLKWLQFAMSKLNPNDLDRQEWLSISAAIKQAGWNVIEENRLRDLWMQWCAQYAEDDPAVNLKMWNSIRDTEVGWKTLENKSTVKAWIRFGHKEPPPLAPMLPAQASQTEPTGSVVVAMPNFNHEAPTGGLPEILDAEDCKEYFKDCFFVESTGKIFTGRGRMMDATRFNGRFGGKHFIITSTSKTTDEAWKAALRSTVWQIPKVDHTRFIPGKPLFHQENDGMGRIGLNTYIPVNIDSRPGDVTPFLAHMARIMPDEGDRSLLFGYMAHAVKFPGYKIPWAPLIQSTEGIGKTMFGSIMAHALGEMYVYTPKADQLIASGNVFNAWMRAKLMILVNEIKIDERLELVEIMKPWITDKRIEVQGKGADQEMEDNAANWFFFSNYKDAIPIKKNGRRYAVFFSAMQSLADLMAAGMDDKYFSDFFRWLDYEGGLQFITHWLYHYPVELGGIPVRAPQTSSYEEALRLSRSPMEIIISDAIADGATGFRGGYVSAIMVMQRSKNGGLRNVTPKAIASCLEGMGFHPLGRSIRPYLQEDASSRSEIFGNVPSLPLNDYGRVQGYE